MITEEDKQYLRRAVDLAKEALDRGDAPFGSLLVSGDGRVLKEDCNQVSGGDHTQHPEFNLARWAAEHMTEEARAKATVYTSGEHCPMCSAAHAWVGLGRIVYASSSKQLAKWMEEMGQAPGPVFNLPIEEVIREARVEGPVLEFEEELRQMQKKLPSEEALIVAFTWDKDQIRWYEEASEASSFHRELASLIKPFLKADDRVCDWGCGLGKLSLELAPYVESIDCVDSDPEVLRSLEEAALHQGRTNIRRHLGQAETMDLACDVGLMVFFGTPVPLMLSCIQRSRRLLIRVMNADREGQMHGGETVAEVEQALQEAAYPYERIEASLAFGQPFSSMEDARAYLSLYNRQGEGLEKRLAQLAKNNHPLYPYYLAKKKELLLLVIDSRQ